jgi:UDP-N-acetyl-D-mannosaminuronic acid dehydrogenase
MKSPPTAPAVTVAPDLPIAEAIRRMSAQSRKVRFAGLVVVVARDGKVEGVVTDGDIRRAFADGVDFAAPVSTIMTPNPISVIVGLDEDKVVEEVRQQELQRRKKSGDFVRQFLVLDKAGRLVDIRDFLEMVWSQRERDSRVSVIGLGYVGLTLAVVLANLGLKVTGVDIDAQAIAELKRGRIRFKEPGLEDALSAAMNAGMISFDTQLKSDKGNVFIVTVGTPVDGRGKPDLAQLKTVGRALAKVLERGDLVMLRSTVPAGTTRDYFIPLLETQSGLRAGSDFNIAFAPERTSEGRALFELRNLPQIVGGLGVRCAQRAARFWSLVNKSVVQVPSLEAAELVKLANNTFRDLSFAFANELALMSDRYNIKSSELIKAANEGYPRNTISLPSPGVGGYCLTKDPHIYSNPRGSTKMKPVLGHAGRGVNELAAKYPGILLQEYCAAKGLHLADINVLLVGMAFKGFPETDDLRGSTAVETWEALKGRCRSLAVWDAIVPPKVLGARGMQMEKNLDKAVRMADAILVLNNHPENVKLEHVLLSLSDKNRLVFDGWSQFEAVSMEASKHVTYATMGYMSIRKHTPLK